MAEETHKERMSAWEKARFAPPPSPDLCPREPTYVEMVPMRDGVQLYTEVFLPEGKTAGNNDPFPVIFCRSPYPFGRSSRNAGSLLFQRYLDAGYAMVFQLTRGQGRSEGVFRFFKDDLEDGYDAIEWIAEQSWCDENVGMHGASYLGSTQLLAARMKPPALKCIMPTAFVGNFTLYFPFARGVPHRGWYMQWHKVADAEGMDELDCKYGDMIALEHPKWGPAFRHRPLIEAADEVLSGDKLDSWRETVSHPLDDDFWAPVHFTDDQLAELDIPIFITDGWYDMTFGPIDYFTRLERVRPERDDRYLLVGPWNHYQTASPSQPGDDDGDRVLPDNGVVDHVGLRIRFFDRYLKGDDAVSVQENRVRVYITGAKETGGNEWYAFPTFPPPNTEYKKLYLHSDGDARTFPGNGVLNWEPPSDEPVDAYTYNPAMPTASITMSYKDRRDTEVRSDVLTYTSAPLDAPLTIFGEIKLILHAASDAPDTDWFAVITEVFPDGQSKSFHYATPCMRARYREGFDREVLLTPNKPEEFCLPMGPAGHQIAAGNRLRLSIFSAAFPEYDPNLNTGNTVITDCDPRVAHQTIYHDAARPSHIVLPIIELEQT